MDTAQEGLSTETIIRAIPSGALPTSYSWDAVTVTNKETQAQEVKVILTLVTPQGINKFWFDAQNLQVFCSQGLAEAKDATKPRIQRASVVPPKDSRQAAVDAKQAAEELLRKR